MSKVRELTADQRISFCPHCGNTSLQRLLYEHHASPKYYSDGELVELGEFHQFFFAACESCDAPLLYYLHSLNTLIDSGYSAFQQAELEWPIPGELPSCVPEKIRARYAEAARTKRVAPNAFAVLIRKALEALCDDRSSVNGPLATRLRDLAFRGEMPQPLAEMGDVLRLLGNIGAHNDSSEVSMHDAESMDEFFKAIVEYVYIGPDRLRRYRDAQQVSKEEGGSDTRSEDDAGQNPTVH